MRIGLFVGTLELMRDVAERLHRISAAERDGSDMLTVIAMAGMQPHRIELGTAVVPTYQRHRVALAQQALTEADVELISTAPAAQPAPPPDLGGGTWERINEGGG